MDTALAEHQPLSVVCLRLEHFQDCRDFLGPERSEQLVRGVARRIERRLAADDRAFRVRPDAFVLVLAGRTLAEARELAAEVAHDVSANLIAGRRQTLAAGASSFPTIRRLPDLLAAARDEALVARREPGRPSRRRSRWRPRSDAAARAGAASCYLPPASLVFACGDRHRQRAGPRGGRRARAACGCRGVRPAGSSSAATR